MRLDFVWVVPETGSRLISTDGCRAVGLLGCRLDIWQIVSAHFVTVCMTHESDTRATSPLKRNIKKRTQKKGRKKTGKYAKPPAMQVV